MNDTDRATALEVLQEFCRAKRVDFDQARVTAAQL